MWQPAVGTGMENDSKVENLEKHLDGKDASEDVVEVGENLIPDWEVFWYLHIMVILKSIPTSQNPVTMIKTSQR